ncbi:MAG TPA: hypothetical protein VFM93_10635 [Candidatus Limnocylindria bacterium]|nr:hypothetical protein [Candidatus Limnocylindria bacterium]
MTRTRAAGLVAVAYAGAFALVADPRTWQRSAAIPYLLALGICALALILASDSTAARRVASLVPAGLYLGLLAMPSTGLVAGLAVVAIAASALRAKELVVAAPLLIAAVLTGVTGLIWISAS